MFPFLESHTGMSPEYWSEVVFLTVIIGITVMGWILHGKAADEENNE
jgi:hypothetical protein